MENQACSLFRLSCPKLSYCTATVILIGFDEEKGEHVHAQRPLARMQKALRFIVGGGGGSVRIARGPGDVAVFRNTF
jgi:hypothetical protein